jgi:hypothetical protein
VESFLDQIRILVYSKLRVGRDSVGGYSLPNQEASMETATQGNGQLDINDKMQDLEATLSVWSENEHISDHGKGC